VYTDQDVDLVSDALFHVDWPAHVAASAYADSYRSKAMAVLDALTAAGWHKPPDTEDG
jgi:hypothetical protein